MTSASAKEVKICGLTDGTMAKCSMFRKYPEFGIKVCTSDTECPDQRLATVTVTLNDGKFSDTQWEQY